MRTNDPSPRSYANAVLAKRENEADALSAAPASVAQQSSTAQPPHPGPVPRATGAPRPRQPGTFATKSTPTTTTGTAQGAQVALPNQGGRQSRPQAASPIADILQQYDDDEIGQIQVLQAVAARIKQSSLPGARACLTALEDTEIQPLPFVYNTAISVAGKMRQAAQAFAIFERMNANNVVPDNVTYNTLISAYEKSGEVDHAFWVFESMGKNNIEANVRTYSALISVCEKSGDINRAFAVFDMMRVKNVAPNVYTYSAMISACGRSGDVARAFSVFENMRAGAVVPNIVIYNALISVCMKAGAVDRAFKVWETMRAERVVPVVSTYNALISSCEKAGQADKALEVFDAMLANNITPDVITYTGLIAAFDQCGQYQKVQGFLRNLVEDGLFKKSLGYDATKNILNFHEDQVLLRPEQQDHMKGVDSAVARGLFAYHFNRGNIEPGTMLIVGSHGIDTLKRTIADCVRDRGGTVTEVTYRDGTKNPGCLVVTDMPFIAPAAVWSRPVIGASAKRQQTPALLAPCVSEGVQHAEEATAVASAAIDSVNDASPKKRKRRKRPSTTKRAAAVKSRARDTVNKGTSDPATQPTATRPERIVAAGLWGQVVTGATEFIVWLRQKLT